MGVLASMAVRCPESAPKEDRIFTEKAPMAARPYGAGITTRGQRWGNDRVSRRAGLSRDERESSTTRRLLGGDFLLDQVGAVFQVHRRVGFPRIEQAKLLAVFFHFGNDFLEQQFDAALAVFLADGAVVGPDAHDAGTGLLDQVFQAFFHLCRR